MFLDLWGVEGSRSEAGQAQAAAGATEPAGQRAHGLGRQLVDGAPGVADGGDDQVLHFARSGGWHCLANFAGPPHPLPAGEVIIASGPLPDGRLPADTTAWVRVPG